MSFRDWTGGLMVEKEYFDEMISSRRANVLVEWSIYIAANSHRIGEFSLNIQSFLIYLFYDKRLSFTSLISTALASSI